MGEHNHNDLEFLISAGLPPAAARECLERARGDVGRAIEIWTDLQPSWREPTPPAQANTLTSELLASALHQASTQSFASGQSSDPELAQALELSKHHYNVEDSGAKEAQEMKLAVEASLKSANQMEVDQTGFGLSADEMQIQQAVERSLMESGLGADAVSLVSNNPNYRKREDGLPVGLRNVGNTCYFNSLLQTYFYIPSLRQAILSFPADEAAKKTEKAATVDFMKELQRIFAYFLFTNQKWVDPSPLLKKILDRNGVPVNIGNQEDVSEFNELFLERIAEGLDLTSELTDSSNNSQMIKNMFQGSAVEYLNAQEADGSPIETTQDGVVVAHLILPVVEEEKDIYEALDSYMVDVVEYTTEKGHRTVAEQSRWFKKLPPVLMVQQNRVKFDVNSGLYRKLNTPLRFYAELYMDRYFVEQRESTSQVRKVVSQWRSELAVLDRDIKAITNFKGRSHSLPEAIQSVIDYVGEKEESADSAMAATFTLLGGFLKVETDKLKQLQEEAQAYRTRIEGAYDEFPRKASYSLFAVWIHAGVAGSGHYWAYIRAGKRKRANASPQKDMNADEKNKEAQAGEITVKELEITDKEEDKQWLKFNDIQVTEADALTVFADAIGGSGTATAYFLIYIETETMKAIQEAFLPDAETDGKFLSTKTVKEEIEADNLKFLETLEKFNKSASDDRVERFKSTYENKMAESKQYAEDAIYSANAKDFRIKSFYSFLVAIGMEDLARNEIIKDVYVQTFEKGIEKDIDSSYYKKVSDLLGEPIIQLAFASIFEQQATESLRTEFHNFRKTAQYYSAGLSFFIEMRAKDAMNAFQLALEADANVSHEKAKRTPQIIGTIKFCLHKMFEEAVQKLRSHHLEGSQRFVVICTFTAQLQLDPSDPFLTQLKHFLSNCINNRTAGLEAEAYGQLGRALDQLLNSKFALRPSPTPLKLPEYGRGETEKWEGLARRLNEQLSALCQLAPHLWTNYMPPPPERPNQLPREPQEGSVTIGCTAQPSHHYIAS